VKIIIAGCGKVGDILIENLTDEGHDVVAIDNNSDVLQDIINMYDVMCVCGNAADIDTLNDAGIKSAQMFIAVTSSDELNMLSCLIAKRMGVEHTIARIRNPEYNDKGEGFSFIKQQLELSLTINPELLAAQEILTVLKFPSAVNIETFARRKFEMIEIIIKQDTVLDGMSLIDVRKKFTENFLVCVVRRGENVIIPDGNFVLQAGDKIGLTAEPNEIQKLLKKLSILQKQARNVMILGASRTAYYLAKLLLASGNSVKIIDKEKAKCEMISKLLPDATVIFGDGAKQDILNEEGITSLDAFVALTGIDEENILISCYASSQNVSKVISKVNRPELGAMAEKLGLDTIVSPKKITADVIVRYARALQNSVGSKMETLYKIMDGKAEALEFIVEDGFKWENIPLRDLNTKKNVIIAGILRGKRAIIPSGDDVIISGDRVIIIATSKQIETLSDIIE